MNQYSVKDLQKFDILSDCSAEQLRIMKSSVYWRTYKKGQLLFIEDDPRERIYFLLKGFVKLSRFNKSGKLVYTDYVKSFTMFPCVGLFEDDTYHFSAEAVTDLELFYIPTHVFEEQLKRNKNHLLKVVSSLSDILKTHENRVQQIPSAQHRVHQTLQHLMGDLGRKEGQDIIIDCPITTTEIAHLSGTSRETVSQVFKQLKADNILSCNKKKLIFHKPSFFNEYAN
ncbi:MAG: Crp/Fnr family transcriptional regulator [Bacillus sp. (in: firmicutes)]